MRVLAMNPKWNFKDVRCLHVIVRYIPRGIIVAILYNLTKRDEALITSSLIGVLFV